MAEVIKMPRLSDTMTEGVIAAWHKKVGDPVKKGELLAEVETDKATMELESYKDGTILHLGAPAGGKLQVDDLLVIVGNAGEDISALLAGAAAPAAPAPAPAAEPVAAAPAPAASAAPALDLAAIEEVVLMPRLSDTMTEGVIANWVKKVGDPISKGDVLAEIETDKATMELESYKNGVLLYQGAKAGEKIQVNDLLAIIGPADFKIDEIVAAAKSGVTVAPAAAQPVEAAPAPAAAVAAPAPVAAAAPEVVNTGRILASPLAKKLAADKGIDLRYVKGTGDNGRITKSDIDNYVPAAAAAPVVAAAPAAATAATAEVAPAATVAPFVPGGAGEGYTDTANSQMRKVIAKRLSESKFTAPHFYLKMEINMDNAMAARTKLNDISPVKISFNDMIIKASAMALKKHPAVNSSWMGDFIRTYQHVHIGMAVAIPDGLIVPVIRFADQKTLSQIAAEAKELGGKAKSKKLQPNEFTGNTFTISNLGMMDIDEFTAIVNPPDSCILAVGKIKEEVYRNEKGEFAVRNVLKLTLSCDHRSVDGAVGAAFLQTLKEYLENPVTMLV
jgi:pyruvate dehydrogenase E2 component (dihydrolipoamide acetyltransferase)